MQQPWLEFDLIIWIPLSMQISTEYTQLQQIGAVKKLHKQNSPLIRLNIKYQVYPNMNDSEPFFVFLFFSPFWWVLEFP